MKMIDATTIYISCRDLIFISNSCCLLVKIWFFRKKKKETTAWSMMFRILIVYLWTSIKIPILRNRI